MHVVCAVCAATSMVLCCTVRSAERTEHKVMCDLTLLLKTLLPFSKRKRSGITSYYVHSVALMMQHNT